MLSEAEVEKFADWIIEQEKKMMDLKYPKAEGTENMTNEELLKELGVL